MMEIKLAEMDATRIEKWRLAGSEKIVLPLTSLAPVRLYVGMDYWLQLKNEMMETLIVLMAAILYAK
jgi:hypothetical protein